MEVAKLKEEDMPMVHLLLINNPMALIIRPIQNIYRLEKISRNQ